MSRAIARILNTFEAGRTQSAPFKGVQEKDTLRRYSQWWSTLIIFLIEFEDDPSTSNIAIQTLRQGLFSVPGGITASMQRLRNAAILLHAYNDEGLDYEECLRANKDDNPDSEQEADTLTLRLRAVRLKEALEELSRALVRQEYVQDAFQCGVVAYAAIYALREDGSWKAAVDMSFFLSGMIHCMQLWLLGACLEELPEEDYLVGLQPYVREQCNRYLINTNATPIAELSFWRLLCWSASNDTVRHPTTTVTDDCMQVNHGPVELKLEAWRLALQSTLQHATEVFEDSLLLAIPDAPRYPVSTLCDNTSDLKPGHSFLQDPRNRLDAVKDWLFNRLQATPTLRRRFIKRANLGDEANTIEYRPSAVESYLHANQLFLRFLAVLIYMGSGLPPRRAELIGISWCNQETARNVYLYDGLVAIITGYHKTQWRIGFRPTARVLPPRVGELLVRYLIYVPPFLRFLNSCMQRQTARGFLFSEAEAVWPPDRFGRYVKRQMTATLGFPINTRQWRHIAIALDRRILQGFGSRTYGISPAWGQKHLHAVENSDSEIDEQNSTQATDTPGANRLHTAVHHLQASHTFATNTSTYGNSFDLREGLTDVLLEAFSKVSRQWHQLAQLHTAPSSLRRPLSLTGEMPGELKRTKSISSLVIRRMLWKLPAIESGLRCLFGPHASFRTQAQQDCLNIIAQSGPEAIIILPTGAGKTIVFLVPTLLPGAQVTVVIIPLIALKHDLLRRCKEWGIEPLCYRPESWHEDRLHAVPSLVLIDIDLAVSERARSFLRALYANNRLDRIVLDEAHLLLTASHYREKLGLLGALRSIPCPFVCMTATLPPSAEVELKRLLAMTQPQMLRASSDRPNLEYQVKPLDPGLGPSQISQEELLVREAINICTQDIKQWEQEAQDRTSTARGLCYVRQIALGQRIAKALQCPIYHAGLTLPVRQRTLTAWSEGDSNPFLVATSALSAGLDYPAVRRVLHIGPPAGLVDYAQESGRAGRDGLHAKCTIILAPRWTVNWDTKYVSDFLTEDTRQMAQYLRLSSCLRRHLTAYIDGVFEGRMGTACQDPTTPGSPRRALCTGCRGAILPSRRTEEPSHAAASSPTARLKSNSQRPVSSLPVRTERERSLSEFSYNPSELLEAAQLYDRTAPSSRPVSESEDSIDSSQSPIEDAAMVEATKNEREVYDAAAAIARSGIMDQEAARQYYERRIVTWSRACMPCSYQRSQLVEGVHDDCVQSTHKETLDRLRRGVRFAYGAACWSCAQPRHICPPRPKGEGKCKQPWLVWHSCWTAVILAGSSGREMIQLLGGPLLGETEGITQQYLTWLGKKQGLFNRDASNAALLTNLWLDRMEQITACKGESIA